MAQRDDKHLDTLGRLRNLLARTLRLRLLPDWRKERTGASDAVDFERIFRDELITSGLTVGSGFLREPEE